jgi:hypothetical protein
MKFRSKKKVPVWYTGTYRPISSAGYSIERLKLDANQRDNATVLVSLVHETSEGDVSGAGTPEVR